MRYFIRTMFWSTFSIFCVFTVTAKSLPEPYNDYPVLIATSVGTGSGFFLNSSNAVFLVTAKHVLFKNIDGHETLLSPRAMCVGYCEGTNQLVLSLQLDSLMASNDVRFSSNRDIALVKIEYIGADGKTSSRIDYINQLSKHRKIRTHQLALTKRFQDIDIGDDIYMCGYPLSIPYLSFHDLGNAFPVIKRGIIAGKKFDNFKLVLDCACFPGNSGGPVLLRQEEWPEVHFYIIGVVTDMLIAPTWNVTNDAINTNVTVNSGYTAVEPIDTVTGMLW